MRQIRNGVFETNSSSTHSISINNTTLMDSELIIDEFDGYIYVSLEEFCHWDHSSQNDRLAWLIQTIACSIDGNMFWCSNDKEWKEAAEKLYNHEDFQRLSNEIAGYVGNGCNGIRVEERSEGYIDHESQYGSLNDFLWNYDTSILEFVFGKNVYLHFEFNG